MGSLQFCYRDGPKLTKVKAGELNLKLTGSLVSFPGARQKVLEALEDSLDKRFSNCFQGIVKATEIIDYQM